MGVAAGLLLMAAVQWIPVTGILPDVAVTSLAAIVAGFLAGKFRQASYAGIGMVAIAVIGMRVHGLQKPGWHELALAGCGPIAAMVGAGLRLLARD